MTPSQRLSPSSPDDKLPIDQPSFWQARMYEAIAHGKEIHETVYMVSVDVWKNIQVTHHCLLKQFVKPGMKLLDAGCGYGALYNVMPCHTHFDYLGIDVSPDLIAIAQSRNPHARFEVADVRSLPQFSDKQFDLAICRSLDGMVKGNLGQDVWDVMQTELLRVSRSLLLLSYGEPSEYQLFPTVV